MKRCPKCGRLYTEPDLNFCLNDGELLVHAQNASHSRAPRPFADDAPPTIMMNNPRETNPTGWAGGLSAPTPYQQNTTPAYQPPPFGMAHMSRSLDQTLPTVSLVLGIVSFIFALCCYGGLLFGLPAAIVGFMGLRNVDRDPARYGGKGLAIAGMVLGVITFIISLLLLIFGVAVNVFQP